MSSLNEETSGGTSSSNGTTTTNTTQKKYKGIRCRKWGKWVSEIRVPGTQDRLWLGSYSTPEGAAVAHDVALFCLRGPPPPESSWDHTFNFPYLLPVTSLQNINMSPRSIQKTASDAGMAIDASQSHLVNKSPHANRATQGHGGEVEQQFWPEQEEVYHSYGSWDQLSHETMEGKQQGLSISVEDYL